MIVARGLGRGGSGALVAFGYGRSAAVVVPPPPPVITSGGVSFGWIGDDKRLDADDAEAIIAVVMAFTELELWRN